MISLACDVHTHTLYSRHAYSTILENAAAAASAQLELLGTTDHFSDMLYPPRETGVDVRDYQYLMNTSIWPREWHGVRLLHGCEADIVDIEGHLYGYNIECPQSIADVINSRRRMLKDMVFEHCDYVIASVHNKNFTKGHSRKENTQAYLNALQDPKVFILGHIGRSGVKFELDEVIAAARDMGKCIELNEHSLHGGGSIGKRCREIALRCAELGCMVTTSTDAHIACDIGRMPQVTSMLQEIDFPSELIATRSAKVFLECLHAVIPQD